MPAIVLNSSSPFHKIPRDLWVRSRNMGLLNMPPILSSGEELKWESAVAQLEQVVKRWAMRVTWQRGLPKDLRRDTNAKIFTFGSYKLRVHGPEADIDAVCVGPHYITLEDDFFIVLYNMLKNVSEVSELQCVKSANVPLMRFKFSGISVDLLYARLSLRTIPEDMDVLDESLLRDIDDTSVKSLKGCRVAARILRLVPNAENFRSTLRCIKFWAKRRGVYSHIVGFPGGVHWAILVAHVCQLLPDGNLSMLVSRFFWMYACWKWPIPVSLVNVQSVGPDGPEKHHHMPIIVPVHPYECCSYNITRATLLKLKGEFSRGRDIIREMEAKHGTHLHPSSDHWNALFDPFPFFTTYDHFIQIHLTAVDEDDLRSWRGWVESRFRYLLSRLDKLPLFYDPNPSVYFNKDRRDPHCYFFWGLRLQKKYYVNMPVLENEFRTYLSNGYEGRPGCKVYLNHRNCFQVPDFVFSKSSELRQYSKPSWANEKYNNNHRTCRYSQYASQYFVGYIGTRYTDGTSDSEN